MHMFVAPVVAERKQRARHGGFAGIAELSTELERFLLQLDHPVEAPEVALDARQDPQRESGVGAVTERPVQPEALLAGTAGTGVVTQAVREASAHAQGQGP